MNMARSLSCTRFLAVSAAAAVCMHAVAAGPGSDGRRPLADQTRADTFRLTVRRMNRERIVPLGKKPPEPENR